MGAIIPWIKSWYSSLPVALLSPVLVSQPTWVIRGRCSVGRFWANDWCAVMLKMVQCPAQAVSGRFFLVSNWLQAVIPQRSIITQFIVNAVAL